MTNKQARRLITTTRRDARRYRINPDRVLATELTAKMTIRHNQRGQHR